MSSPGTDSTRIPAPSASAAFDHSAGAKLRRITIAVAIGALVAAALASVVWVLFGTQSAIVGRAVLTVLLLAAFAGVTALDAALAARREPWFQLVSTISWVYCLLAGAVLIWMPEPSWRSGLSFFVRLFAFLLIVLVVQLAVLHIRLYSRTLRRARTRFTTVTVGVTIALVVLFAIGLSLPLMLGDWFFFHELYWRLLVAIMILAAVGTALVPLVNALLAPRSAGAAGVSIAATKSALADIVTEADREVEDLIRARLAVRRPDDGFLGEESGEADSASGIVWVVDPIDGTVNYAYGIPAYAVSIAAVEGSTDPGEWTALAGAVFNPMTGELFRASRGGGAWLQRGDGAAERLAVRDEVSPAGALLATGFGYDPATHAGDLARLGGVMSIARDIRRMGAASLDLASVAAGRLDAYYERGLHPWDLAAGTLLVVEAGGRVGGLAGRPMGREMTIAASPAVFDRLTELVSAG